MGHNVADKLRDRCQRHALGHGDDAKRLCDGVNARYSLLTPDAILAGRWVAFRMSDGSVDRSVYDTKRDAVRHQSDEFVCGYLKLTLLPMTICEAETILKFHRGAYDSGFRLPDPDARDGGKEMIMPIGQSERLIAANSFPRNRHRR